MEKNIKTNYKTAANWLHSALILCNNIGEIDPTILDNMRFELEEEDENGDFITRHEIYQYFLTDCNEYDVEFLEEHFDLLFTYSELLDVYVLCVDHFGTPWSGVDVYTDIENAATDNDK